MATTESINQDSAASELQLVIFDLADESYGIDIGAVREIIRMQEITNLPGISDYILGVINLRGRVVPVVDLRRRFDLDAGEFTEKSRIVVVDIGSQDIGVIVDAVHEVLSVPSNSIETAAGLTTGGDTDYLMGIVKLDQRLIILLDLAQALSEIDVASYQRAA